MLTHTHIYTQAGVYTVALSVSDGVLTDTLPAPAAQTQASEAEGMVAVQIVYCISPPHGNRLRPRRPAETHS